MALGVAITGMGVVSALGHTPSELYARLRRDDLAIEETPWTRDDPKRCEWWAPIKDFNPDPWIDAQVKNGTAPFAQHALVAACTALRDAGLEALDPLRTTVVLGTTKCGTQTMEKSQFDFDRGGREAVSGKDQIKVWANLAASQIALRWRLHGPCLTLVTACASSLDAIGLGARFIASGMADVALVGGSEGGLGFGVGENGFIPASAVSRAAYGMGAPTDDPRRACMPFDKNRAGMVFGEGAGVFVLESEAHVRARGARALAWVQGWGTGADSYHPSTPDPSGDWERLVMELALAEAGVGAGAIDAIAAHGTGTYKGDTAEIRAINKLFGAHAKKVSVMSIKGTLGHPTGSAGALALVAALEGMANDEVIHTGGTLEADPEIEFDLVLGSPRKKSIGWLQINAFGFGGQNASLVLSAEKGR